MVGEIYSKYTGKYLNSDKEREREWRDGGEGGIRAKKIGQRQGQKELKRETPLAGSGQEVLAWRGNAAVSGVHGRGCRSGGHGRG